MNMMYAKLSGIEFDTMGDRGAFDFLEGKKVELIRGQLRFLHRESAIHDGTCCETGGLAPYRYKNTLTYTLL